MEKRANTQLEAALDNNNYDETQLVSIKIPVTYLPYYNNSKSFERIDGQIQIEGIEYKYVKRRIYDDSLELLCIPNPAIMNLQAAKNEFFKFVNDLQHAGRDKNGNSRSGSSKNFSLDHYTIHEEFTINDIFYKISPISFNYFALITSRYQRVVEQPPDNS